MGDWQNRSVFVVGLGSIGQRHIRVLTGLGVKKISIFDIQPTLMEKTMELYPNIHAAVSFEEGLSSNPDCVFILTPPKLHIPQIIKAAQSGCHVFSEKPLSDTMDGVEHLRSVLDVAGITFGIGLCFRYHEGVCKLKHALNSGAVGRVVSIRAMMGEHFPTIRPDYRTLFSSKYSGAFDLTHDLDLAVWFANGVVVQSSMIYGSYSDIGIEAPDVVEIIMAFDNRCIANVHLDFFQQPRSRTLELLCTRGKLSLEFSSWDEYTLSIYKDDEKAWDRQTCKSRRDDMFACEDRAFLKKISGEEAVVYGFEDGLATLELLHAAKDRKTGL